MHRSYLLIAISALLLLLTACNDKDKDASSAPAEFSRLGLGAWELVWSDEFDGHALDTDKWTYVDDSYFATQTLAGWFAQYRNDESRQLTIGKGAAQFDQSFHVQLNLPVGGHWPSPPNTDTLFPQQIKVDYVRVFQCSADKGIGRGERHSESRSAASGRHCRSLLACGGCFYEGLS